MRRVRVPAVLLVAGAVTLPLVSCSSEPDPGRAGEEADGTAAALAAGLEDGDLADVPFADAEGGELTGDAVVDEVAEVVAGMGEVEPSVVLGDVAEDGDDATATLAWTWPLDQDRAWTYETDVDLRRADDEWRVVWSRAVVEGGLEDADVLDATPVEAPRGDVLGAGGTPLVTARQVVRVGIDRAQVPVRRAGASAARLARLVGVDVRPFVERVEAAGDLAFVEAITFRFEEMPASVTGVEDTIRGARLVTDEVPLAPTREFAAPVLGSVGEVTAEMVEEDPERYQPGDTAGLSGLQARYEDQLRGTDGVVVNAVTPDGEERELFRVDEEAGAPLRLTLDRRLQSQAEAVLADVGPPSALVAVRPSDGAVLAAANGPGNDGQNLATFGQYAPGSTFKVVSALALLRAGLRPEATVPCTPTVDVDGRDFENYDDYPASALGRVPFRTAFASSCNTAFIAERRRLGDADLADAAASLGLGVDHDLGFPAYFGQVEPPTTETGAAADMIGQGTVLASPMAMAAVMASVQRGGTVLPHLLPDLDAPEAGDVPPLRAREAEQLRDLLRAVVTDGSGSLLADVPGPPVLAKTGTAEYVPEGGGLATHAWMVAAQGDLAVAVFVGDGASGSGTAGPLLERFLRAAR